IRNAAALEHAGRLTTLVVDKTGTLTEGTPSVADILPAPGHSSDDVLALAAALEQGSTHPLATAIVRKAQDARLNIRSVTDYNAVPGKGARANVDGVSVIVGSMSFLAENGVDARGDVNRQHTVVG